MSESSRSGGELFIVDNSDSDWKVHRYLKEWCHLSKAIDVATGFFEVGGLLTLDGAWQTVPQIRILMGDEVSKRTKKAFADGLTEISARLDRSIDEEKAKDDFIKGVPAIVAALQTGQIKCRVYRKDKFHAKAYISHAQAVFFCFRIPRPDPETLDPTSARFRHPSASRRC